MEVVFFVLKHENFLVHDLCLLLEEFLLFLFLLGELFDFEPELVLDRFEGALRFLFFFSYDSLVHLHSLPERVFQAFLLLLVLCNTLFQPTGPCLELSDFLVFLVQLLKVTFGAHNRFGS